MQPQPRYKKGDKIGGRYLVHQALMGGMGEVYLCFDLESGLPYALKTFQARCLSNKKLIEAFKNEVATWVSLEKHPNIVRCFYLQMIDKQPFMLLEWIASDENYEADLRNLLRQGPLDLRLALDFTIDVCRGIIHAGQKRRGIVHRDLKPENILIARGRVAKITDFGLAKIVENAGLEISATVNASAARQSLIGSSGIVGTPQYMAPEQWLNERLDERTDIYAVGCILYEMIIGHPPFEASTLDGLRRQHLEGAIPNVVKNKPHTKFLFSLLDCCLAKRKEKRFANVTELLQELSKIYENKFSKAPKALEAHGEFTATDYINRGFTYEQLQRYDNALSDYNRAIQLDPTDALAYNNRGALYDDRLRRHDDAIADLSRAIELDPTFAAAYSNRGQAYANLRRYDKALNDFSKSLELNPKRARYYVNRGATYHEMQRYEDALADYTRAIELDPKYALAYTNRGNSYKNLQLYEKALADHNKAIQLDPFDAPAYNNRASTYERLQRYKDALTDYTRAIQLDAKYVKAYTNRGTLYARLQLYDEALEDLNNAIQLDPAYSLAYFNLGVLFLDLEEWQEALFNLEKAAQLGDPDAAQHVIRIRQMLNDLYPS